MTNDNDRASFEAHFMGCGYDFTPDNNDSYKCGITSILWRGYQAARANSGWLPEEIKPCPYVSGFNSNNTEVSWFLKRYEGYFDFILVDNGKPSRCFRFLPTPPKGEE